MNKCADWTDRLAGWLASAWICIAQASAEWNGTLIIVISGVIMTQGERKRERENLNDEEEKLDGWLRWQVGGGGGGGGG